LTVTFDLVLRHLLQEQVDQRLRTRAVAIVATVRVAPAGTLSVDEAAGDSELDTGVWVYQGKVKIEQPSISSSLTRAADTLAGRDQKFVDSGTSRLYAVAVRKNGRQLGTVVTQVNTDAYTYTGQIALAGSVAIGILLLGCVYLATLLAVRRAMRPVSEMSAEAARRSTFGAGERFGTVERPAELSELGTNLDALLDRITSLLHDERRLTAELSHELRNPLARICAEAEWLGKRPRSAEEQRDSHAAIAEAAERMRVICQTLLTETRPGLELGKTATEVGCRAADVLQELAHRIPRDPSTPAIRVLSGDGAPVVPAAIVERILSPLLDNACRYAVREVTLACRQTADAVVVSVSDDGPGVPDDLAAAIFQAGWRADPTDGHAGVGLGLPLARRLARSAGGDVVLVRQRDGASGPVGAVGARFEVTLARAR
jgi:two-component system heavy metal sensor histidine kinase CusS